MKELIKARKLNAGDKVAAISLSWGGAGRFPYRFEVGRERLESLFGLEVVPTRHALRDEDWIYKNPKARADDLMEAFLDPSIKGVFSNIGGDDSIRLLPFVDLEVIRRNPKVFIGYSDTTVSHFMCLKAGVGSFYGPAIMTGFAENLEMHQYAIEGIRRSLFSNEVIGDIPQNREGWTKEFLDWADPENQKIRRRLEVGTRWKFLGDCKEMKRGRLIGGCLEVLQVLNGTELWPKLEDWEDSILFLETSENGIEPLPVLKFMRNLGAQGILSKLKGMLFSKPGGPEILEERFCEYDEVILRVFQEYDLPRVPIVTGMDFGHSDPMWTLPYGALTEIDPIQERVSILESGVI